MLPTLDRRPPFPGFPALALPAFLMLLILLAGCGVVDRMSGTAVAKELQERGVAAPAAILRLWDTGITVNQDPVVGLEVEVRPADRPPYKATIAKSLISRLDIPRFQPGQVIPVRFDPQDPTRVAIDVYKYR
jgi:hypothetical protein